MAKRRPRNKNASGSSPQPLFLPEDCGSLIEHLHSIYTGIREMPTTDARRHHFVAQTHLARFTSPATSGSPKLWKLDKHTGSCEQVTTGGTAWEKDLYAVTGEDGDRNTQMESLFGLFEDHAARSIERLLTDPAAFEFGDRFNLSLFIALQEQRTPAALQRMSEILSNAGTMFAYTTSVRADGDGRAACARQALLDGKITIRPTDGMQMGMLMEGILATAPQIHKMGWQVMRARTGEFVISDCPLTMRDPTPRHAFTGNAWMSSANAHATLPLSTEFCLRLDWRKLMSLEYGEIARQVDTINLRTYGWAERYVMGRSQECLVALHEQAIAAPETVPRQKPRHLVTLEDAETANPADAIRNADRGWDSHVSHAPPDGPRRKMSYRVIESQEDVLDTMAPRGTQFESAPGPN